MSDPVPLGQQLSALARGEDVVLDLSADDIERAMKVAHNQVDAGFADRALNVLRGIARAHPDTPAVQQQLGIALEKTGDLAGASAAYSKNVELLTTRADEGSEAQIAEGYVLRARVEALRGDRAAARADLERAAALESKSEAVQAMLTSMSQALSP